MDSQGTVTQLSINFSVGGLAPGSPDSLLHVIMSLDKTLNPEPWSPLKGLPILIHFLEGIHKISLLIRRLFSRDTCSHREAIAIDYRSLSGKMNGSSMDFKALEVIVHFNSRYTELFVEKLNNLSIYDPEVLFRKKLLDLTVTRTYSVGLCLYHLTDFAETVKQKNNT